MTLALAVYSGLVLLLAYRVRGMAGFGSGLIAVPLLTLVWPVTGVVPLVVALDYLGSASQGAGNLRQVAWRDQLVLIPFMVVGVAVGVWALHAVSRATFAVNFLIDGGVRLAAFAAGGLYGRQTLGYLLVAIPVAAAGLYVGGRLQTRLSPRGFQIVIRVLLLVSGVALLLK